MQQTDPSALEEARALATRSSAPPAEMAGAVAITAEGTRHPGVAVHLAGAPGLGICAEHAAICAARAASDAPIREIALWVPAAAEDHPCGRCRQVWLELAPETRFTLQRGDDPPQELELRELLPDAFQSFPRDRER